MAAAAGRKGNRYRLAQAEAGDDLDLAGHAPTMERLQQEPTEPVGAAHSDAVVGILRMVGVRRPCLERDQHLGLLFH